MKIDFDDPKWTAYVLGELSPEQRRAVELELESSEDLKLFVEELQIAAFAMKDAMAGDVSVGLTFQQRAVVRAAAEGKATLAPSERAWFRQPFAWAAAGLAAAGLIVTVAPSIWRSKTVEPTQVAQQKTEQKTEQKAEPKVEGNAQVAAAPGGAGLQGPPVSTERAGTVNPQKTEDQKAAAPESVIAKAFVDEKSSQALRRDLAEGLRSEELLKEKKDSVSAKSLQGASTPAGDTPASLGQTPNFANLQLVPPSIPALVSPPGAGPAARGGRGGAGGGQAQGRGGVPAGSLDFADTFSFSSRSGAALVVNPAVPASPTVTIAGPAAPSVPNPVDARANRADADYELIGDNPFVFVNVQQVATFSSDVDTASYSNVRRFINSGQLPPRAAVRIEEMLNYFTYGYPKGSGDHPITANIEASSAPWNPEHRLVRIGISAKDVQVGDKPSNLVFLIDVSGSMEPSERLPLLKSGLRMLVERLTENDRVTIVTYAGSSGIALPPTNGTRKEVIHRAIDELRAEGSTNGGEGIQTAYDLAAANFIRGGVNRVVLMTDGDFNVGITDQNALVRLIEEKAQTGVFLSILGVGAGNVKDAMMERLADRGNGQYAYIDSLNEARKVLVEQMGGTLITVAKDVKLQVEFNPAQVSAYRLIGYEDRVLTQSDFSNDRRDAGDMGAGHTVTALFEVVPVGIEVNNFPGAGPLRYQQEPLRTTPQVNAAVAQEMLNLRIRYKEPEGSESKLIDFPLVDRGQTFERASVDFRFAAAVAEFGMMLRSSPHRGSTTWSSALAIARESRGADREGYREEFIRLVQLCEQIARSAAR